MRKRLLQFSVLVAGIFSIIPTITQAQWDTVGPTTGPGFDVFVLRSKDADLYAGGTGVAKWDGTAWTSMGRVAPNTPLGLGYLGINAMVEFHGELYAGGDIDSLGGVYINPTIAVGKWNGTTWEQVGTSAPPLSGVTSLVVYHDELYAGGNYGVNKWDGTTWTSVGDVDGPANVVLAVYHDELYAASSFSHIGTTNMTTGKGFAKWNGTTWTALTGFYDTISALPTVNVAKVASLIVFKDELFAFGSIDYAGTTFLRGVGRWNGTTWNTANGGITGNGTQSPNSMSIDSNFLYVVGPIQKANTTNDSIYLSTYWDGTKWNQMFGGNAPYTSFFATENYQGQIYSAWSSLVRWDGTTLTPEVNNVKETKVFPSPSNGKFSVVSKTGNGNIKVMNALGAVVYDETFDKSVTVSVDMGNVSPGIYIMELQEGPVKTFNRIIIEK